MPLGGVHFLLTYRCDRECDHCFVFGGPSARGTFSLDQLRRALDQLTEVRSIETAFFEGGEPFLYYPVLAEAVMLAGEKGFQVGIVTNAYWATCAEDAALWLRPLREAGLSSLCISDDELHYGQEASARTHMIEEVASGLDLSVSLLLTEPPQVGRDDEGRPVISGGVMFRGRAAERMTEGMPRRPWDEFTECPAETLDDPGRVHMDACGNVHLCQGLLMGNAHQMSFAEVVEAYEPAAHPIVGPLLEGGPAALAERYGRASGRFVDACHLCYTVRRALRESFPRLLGPDQVYGA